MPTYLLFVYNATSGKLNSLLDAAHKMLNPDTYSCELCAITHGVFKEDALWKAFRNKNPDRLKFMYKDVFESKFKPPLPILWF